MIDDNFYLKLVEVNGLLDKKTHTPLIDPRTVERPNPHQVTIGSVCWAKERDNVEYRLARLAEWSTEFGDPCAVVVYFDDGRPQRLRLNRISFSTERP